MEWGKMPFLHILSILFIPVGPIEMVSYTPRAMKPPSTMMVWPSV